MIKFVKDGFSIDSRTMAVFRILLGSLVILDGIWRIPTWRMLFSSEGIFPRGFYSQYMTHHWSASVYYITDIWYFQMALLAFSMFCGLLLMVGYRTKLMTFLCWVMIFSVQNRNHMTLCGGDIFFRMLLFWSLFAPLGKYYSVDQCLAYRENKKELMFSPGSMTLILQVLFVYVFTAILKWHPSWYKDGTALYYALNIDLFAKPFGVWFRQFEALMKYMTYYILALEGIGPFFAVLPFWKVRMIATSLFFSLHLGIESMMEIALFPYTCGVAWSAFIPGQFWTWSGADRYFDSLENLFKRIAGFIRPLKFWPFKDWRDDRTNYHSLPRWSACILFTGIALFWNIESLDKTKRLPEALNFISASFNFHQNWSMFAPYPRHDDGWILLKGEMMNGDFVNVIHPERKFTFDKPKSISADLPHLSWGNTYYAIWIRKSKSGLHESVAKYYCREWNRKEKSEKRKLRKIDIIAMYERTPPPGYPIEEPTEKSRFEFKCFNSTDDIY